MPFIPGGGQAQQRFGSGRGGGGRRNARAVRTTGLVQKTTRVDVPPGQSNTESILIGNLRTDVLYGGNKKPIPGVRTGANQRIEVDNRGKVKTKPVGKRTTAQGRGVVKFKTQNSNRRQRGSPAGVPVSRRRTR